MSKRESLKVPEGVDVVKDIAFLAIIVGVVLYYTYKKKFEIAYSVFLSGMIGAVLKYMVSNLAFTNAPPSLQVMTLATLSVFNGFFWLVTLAFFVLAMDYPLGAVSGLLLGYGLGKWHLMRRKRILFEKGEVKRKIVHSISGLVLSTIPFFLDKWIVLPLYLAMAVFAFVVRYIKLPFLDPLVVETKREKEWTGKGVFYFMLGSLLPVYLEQPWIILVLGVGDGLATLIGRFFGYTPLYRDKTVEGCFAGFIGALAVSRHFYSPAIIPVTIYLLAELLAPIDDNLAVPIALSMLYLF